MVKPNILIIDFNSMFMTLINSMYKARKNDLDVPSVMSSLCMNILDAINFSNAYQVAITFEGSRNKNWKLDIYKHYKYNRTTKTYKDGDLTMDMILEYLNPITSELTNRSPFITVRNPSCESDDVIASIVMNWHDNYNRIYILSKDSDFDQLTSKYQNVHRIYPDYKGGCNVFDIDNEDMRHKIIKGSKKEFLPNALMPDDYLYEQSLLPVAERKNQTAISKKSLAELPSKISLEDLSLQYKYFERNYKVMAMINIPKDIQSQNLSLFNESLMDKHNLMRYEDYLKQYIIM